MARLFGTDGIRGVANDDLNSLLAYKTGQAAALTLSKSKKHSAKIYIGKDTRVSSDMLEAALCAGICSVGSDAILLGYLPTPAVSYLTAKHDVDAGIVITASHNSFEYNGIKIFNSEGYKLPDNLIDEIEDIILSNSEPTSLTGASLGRVSHLNLRDEYIDFLTSTIDGDLSGLNLVVDCANGAASRTAHKLFSRLKANTMFIANTPDGININRDCGSTHLKNLQAMVTAGNYYCGIAFDGDADRCLLIDENGQVIDGDQMIGVIGKYLKDNGKLKDDSVVVTVMSNLGFMNFAKENGIVAHTTAVGDQNVLELMKTNGYVLGGEQSGHIIFGDILTTGAGELSAIQFLSIAKKLGLKASELAGMVPKYPQVLINVRVENDRKTHAMTNPTLLSKIAEFEKELGSDGRILVRASGTEPLIRVMVEGKLQDKITQVANTLAEIVKG